MVADLLKAVWGGSAPVTDYWSYANRIITVSGATVTADGVTDFLLEDLLRYEKTLNKIRDYGTI